ncbi:MAG: hypothetical protein KF764_02930 [Labilithrix sp.]|nr:hypothetical protein [Labilithrix sp.]
MASILQRYFMALFKGSAGTVLPARNVVRFANATVEDDAAAEETVITVEGGGGSGGESSGPAGAMQSSDGDGGFGHAPAVGRIFSAQMRNEALGDLGDVRTYQVHAVTGDPSGTGNVGWVPLVAVPLSEISPGAPDYWRVRATVDMHVDVQADDHELTLHARAHRSCRIHYDDENDAHVTNWATDLVVHAHEPTGMDGIFAYRIRASATHLLVEVSSTSPFDALAGWHGIVQITRGTNRGF